MARSPVIFRATVVIAVVIAALALLDSFLARTETREVKRTAAAAYGMGSRLLAEGKPAEAVEPLRKAWVLVREDPGYELQLGNALAAVGKLAEAEPHINQALSREPDDGEANLAAARLTVRQRNIAEADSYYHRAIYGKWRQDAARHRIAARLELIELLAEERRRQDMLAELISLEEEASDDVAVQKKVARFFMVAGAPARAANVYRAQVEKDPSDAESYIGLGEAELESGRYRPARNAFVRAALHSSGATIASRLELVDMLTALDPTPRQLTSLEKYRRSVRILDWVRADAEQQLESHPGKDPGDIAAALKQAKEALAKKEPAHVSNELAEGLLGAAEQLWRARVKTFGDSVPKEEEVLRLIMERVTA